LIELWRHRRTGLAYMVVVRDGVAVDAAGPLVEGEAVMFQRGVAEGQNLQALADMQWAPQDYLRSPPIGQGEKL
jgi:hypothetical protein